MDGRDGAMCRIDCCFLDETLGSIVRAWLHDPLVSRV
jgi:hypothetical protein